MNKTSHQLCRFTDKTVRARHRLCRCSPLFIASRRFRHDIIREVEFRSHPLKWLVNHKLSPHITNLVSHTSDIPRSLTDLSVCFLGTGAGQPNDNRCASGTALLWGGGIYVFDVGEGIQLQAKKSGLGFGNIQKIFITHMHGDHVFGLPSLLLSMQDAVKHRDEPMTVKIYGPVGLFNFIATALSLSYAQIKTLTVEVYELHGGTRRWLHPGTIKNFDEFRHRSLCRKSISPNQDGTWTLETPNEVETSDDGEMERSSRPSGFHVCAAQVNHVPNLQSFGYMVQEPLSQQLRIDVNNATALGVAPDPKYNQLESRFMVSKDYGSGDVHPDELTEQSFVRRKVVFLGDCNGIPLPMADLCREADVMVHEATLLESMDAILPETRGHSTAAMAGLFAEYAQARVLALNHIKHPFSGNLEAESQLIVEARDAIQGSTEVQLAYDQMEIMIPREGFTKEMLEGKNDEPKIATF